MISGCGSSSSETVGVTLYTTAKIAAVLQRWEQRGYAAFTLNHRRGALMHLWARLDGREADNPVARVPRFKEPRPDPRGLSWDDVDRILAAMPERGRPLRGQPLDDRSRTRARIAVIAFTGLTQAQLKKLRFQDVFWRESAIRVPARNKGRGASA